MHKVGFSKPHPSIYEKRIVDLSRGFRNSQGCGMGQVVVGSHHKGVKGVLWIQVGALNGIWAHRRLGLCDELRALGLRLRHLLLHLELDLAFSPYKLGYRHLENQTVFFIYKFEKGLLWNDDGHRVIVKGVGHEGLQPGVVGYIGYIMLLF